ncbi:MAG: hypothetical protein ACLRWQ_09165 [Flavonifractor plautii]
MRQEECRNGRSEHPRPAGAGPVGMGAGPGSPDDPPDGTVRPSLGCCAVALSLVPLHVYLEVEAGDLSAVQDTAHAFALSAAALVLGTLALNTAAWLRTRY